MGGVVLLALMAWAIALSPLIVWIILLSNRIASLERRLAFLDQRAAPAPFAPSAAAVPVAAPAIAEHQLSEPEPELEPVLAVEAADPPPPEPAFPPSPPSRPAPSVGPAVSAWLAQNGLAWMGGAALTLGGLFLVVYAAERGFFTPLLRVLAAGAAGAAMILASEWIRRQKDAPGGRHLLAAALAAGAGAATLYGAVWAAHSLYGLLPFALAAVLITAVSAGLLGLSLLHGEALAVLAIVGAFAVPVVTGRNDWSPPDLDRFLVVLILTGSAAAGLRRWGWAGMAVLVGALIWSLDGLLRSLHLQSEVAIAACAAGAALPVFWRAWAAPEDPAPAGRLRLQAEIAIWSLSAASAVVWAAAGHRGEPIVTAVVMSAVLAVAGAAMAAAGLVRGFSYSGPAAAPAVGVALAALALSRQPSLGDAAVVFALVVVVAGAGLLFGLKRPAARVSLVGAGGPGAAALATVVWIAVRNGQAAPSWLLPFAAAVLLSAGAVVLAGRVQDKTTDRGLALWLAGTVELAFLAVQAATPLRFAPAAHGLLALALAALAVRLGWSGLSQTAVAGGLVVLAAMLRPPFVGDVLAKKMGELSFGAVAAAAAVQLFVAGRMVRGRSVRDSEALGTWSLMVFLLGVFLFVHVHAAAAPGAAIGPLLEAGLRTDLLLAAALVLYQRSRDDEGPIARWRRLAVLWVGVAHGVLLQFLIFNPWSGLAERPLGPLLVDTLALSYLAPAGLLALIAREQRRAPLTSRRLAAVFSLVFALAWVLLEIRRAFHIDLGQGPVERGEACGYALTALLTARALWRLKSRAAVETAYLGQAAPICGALALAIALEVFCWYASPWWGALTGPLHGAGETVLLLAAYGAGIAATLWLEKVPAPEGWGWLEPAALTAAMAELFVVVTLIVRWSFRGADMSSAGAHESVETWAFSAVWAVFGLAALVTGGLRRGGLTLRWIGLVVLMGTLAKVLLFDMERLSGMIRAGSFLAVGALLIFAALAARRLDAGGGFLFGRARAHPEGGEAV